MDIFRKHGAKAIWKDDKKLLNRYVRFQTEFDATDKNVLFYISSENQYELYINGQLASFGQYGDLITYKVYDCIDISPFVKEGKNLVSILSYSGGKDTFSYTAGLPLVIFAAVSNDKAILVSDGNVKCSDDTEFTSGEMEVVTPQLGYNFGIDLRKDDFFREKNVSATWDNAFVCDDSDIEYFSRPVKKTERIDVTQGKIITQGEFNYSDGETIADKMQYAFLGYREKNDVFDFCNDGFSLKKDSAFWVSDLGEEMAGHITLDVEADEGATLDIAYGEHLADMRVRSSIGARNFAFRVVCKEGRQKISFFIKRLACRYLQVFAQNGVKKIHTLGLERIEYPLHYNPLKLNNSLYNKMYETSQKTLMLCMHEHHEDCPWREQALYGMDSRNQMIAGYYAFCETDMPRASINLFERSQKEDGLFEFIIPGSYARNMPSFSTAWLVALGEYVLFSGDLDFAEDMLPAAKRLVEFFKFDEEKKLVVTPTGDDMWNFYEWNDCMNTAVIGAQIRYDAPLNAFFALALQHYVNIATWLDKPDEAQWAQEKYNMIKEHFHDAFYCPDRKSYKIYLDDKEPQFAQLTSAWALCSGIVPKEYQEVIRNDLAYGDNVEITLSHSVYMYDALMQDPDTYADFVMADIDKKWGHMLYSGATSFWETMGGEEAFSRAGSLCHGWSATPAYIFWRYVMGIYPSSPGFKTVSINPCCNKNLCGEGELKTPSGTFKVKLENGKSTMEKM